MPSEPLARSRQPGPLDLARTGLAVAAILPGLAAGFATLAWTRDRRRSLNRTLSLWGDLGTAAAGIRLDVRGARHLEEARPAVFVLNHQSGIDPILLCALLRRDFVGVAKREILRNPLLGPAFAFVGTVFVDRFDRAAAVRALQPAIDMLHAGISVAVAPEGTRSRGRGIGRFKKGAFRLAMAAKVPVVPIVIHNSAAVLPRGGWLMTPAKVRVDVHAPMATEGWSPGELDDRIAEVEALYAGLEGALGASAARSSKAPVV